MKQTKRIVWVALCAILFSFSTWPGADRFEVYLNSKLLVQQYVSAKTTTPEITLEQEALNDELSVHYSHCGKIGTDRRITIKDARNNILKEWQYANALTGKAPMTCKVKDIAALQKGNPTLDLFYTSRELPEGRLLVNLRMTKEAKTVSLNH